MTVQNKQEINIQIIDLTRKLLSWQQNWQQVQTRIHRKYWSSKITPTRKHKQSLD
jgi:hypothetical protein